MTAASTLVGGSSQESSGLSVAIVQSDSQLGAPCVVSASYAYAASTACTRGSEGQASVGQSACGTSRAWQRKLDSVARGQQCVCEGAESEWRQPSR